MRNWIPCCVLALALPLSAAAEMTVDWEWKKEHRCNDTSPALAIAGIPEGVKSLSVQMNDLDYQNKDHGGGTVPHAGGATATIAEGALRERYLGPCPNNYASFGHAYQIVVRGLGADGAEVARATKAKDFSARTAK